MSRILIPDQSLRLPSQHLEVEGFIHLRSGYYDGKLRERTRRELVFPNLITNNGMNSIGTYGIDHSTHPFGTFRVGAGNSTPAFTDVTLQSVIASTTSSQADERGMVTTAGGYGWRRITRRFAQGAAAGNVAEVGVGWATALFNRALVLDGGGSPTVLSVLATDFLDVTYEFRNYIPASTTGHAFNLNATPTTYNTSGATGDPTWWNANVPGIEFNPYTAVEARNGTTLLGTVSSAQIVWAAYTPGSFQRGYQATFGIAEANGTINRFDCKLANGHFVHSSLTPAIVKNNTMQLTMNFIRSWSRR